MTSRKAPAGKRAAGKSRPAGKKAPRSKKADAGVTSEDWEALGGDAGANSPLNAPAEAPGEAAPDETPKTKRAREKAEAAKGKTKKPQQQYFDNMKPVEIPEVIQAAEKYEQVRDARSLLSIEERGARQLLESLMEKHNLTFYKFADHEITIDVMKKAKVKRLKADKGESEGADDDPDVMNL